MEPTVGRPKAIIDWEKVKELLEAGCSGREIAADMGINPITLYRRCVEDYEIEFSEFSQRYHAKGEARLLTHQYNKALGLTDKGDNTLLIWLGKNRLGQRDNIDKSIKASLTVMTQDYSNCDENNTSTQVCTEGLSDTVSEEHGQGD